LLFAPVAVAVTVAAWRAVVFAFRPPLAVVDNPDFGGRTVGGACLSWGMEPSAAVATVLGDLDSPAEVLAAMRASRAAEHREAARQLRLAVDWAAMHSADSIHEAATLWAPRMGFEEEALPIAGEGAPLVAEFCVAEFAAALAMPTEVGRLFLGEALELRYRLPRLWKRVIAEDLTPWRARRIARETLQLSPAAVAYVDRHVGPVAHRIGPAQTQRLLEEAIARHMPETAEATRRQAADGRHLDIDHHQISFAGSRRGVSSRTPRSAAKVEERSTQTRAERGAG
jgi:hypothetical protein